VLPCGECNYWERLRPLQRNLPVGLRGFAHAQMRAFCSFAVVDRLDGL